MGLWLIGTALAYWLLCDWSNRFAPNPGAASPVWFADGLALGLFFATAGRARWGVLLGILFGNLLFASTARPFWSVMIGSMANVFQTWAGGVILEWLRDRQQAWRGMPRAIAFFAVAIIGVNAIVAAVQSINFAVTSSTTFQREFMPLFISNALGILAVTPVMMTWMERWDPRHSSLLRGRALEATILCAALIGSTLWIFRLQPEPQGLTPPYFYLAVPLLLWSLVRFGSRGSTLAFLVFATLALYFTSRGTGPFINGGTNVATGLLRLQEFLLVIGGTILFTAAIVRERTSLLRVKTDTERRFTEAMRASQNLIFEIDYQDRRIVWVGDTRDVLGIPAGAISTTQDWTARVHPDDRAYLVRERNHMLTGAADQAKLEYRVRRDDGQYIDIGVSAFVQLARGADGVPSERRVIGFLKDITERRRSEAERERLEAELRQAQKMEAIGQLAGGIAHDFNNILTSIIGYGELAQKHATNDTLKRQLDTILKAGDRGRQLVSQILTYSRKNSDEKIVVNLHDVLDEIVVLVRGSNPHDIALHCPEGLDTELRGNPTTLHQLFMNLATNALQAMPDGGTLDVTIGRTTLLKTQPVAHGHLEASTYLVVNVQDHGSGIDTATLARMFEPFYTTKSPGRGTGIGLALAMSVARAHGGGIAVESQVGIGTTFTVYLPAMVAGETTIDAALVDAPRGQDECILLVDDETPLRELAEEMLVELGYQVVSFGDSEEAMRAFAANPTRFDAVLSDEVMPGFTGTQLTAQMIALRPELPVIIITAYGGPGFELRAQQAGVRVVLKKPYHQRELAETLSRLFLRS